MVDESYQEIEELVREMSESPALSVGLRERIIAESVTALSRDRREARRQNTIIACGVPLVLGITLWFQSLLIPAAAAKISKMNTLSLKAPGSRMAHVDPSTDGLSALMAMSEVGDWGHVEAVTRMREMHRQALWMFSGF